MTSSRKSENEALFLQYTGTPTQGHEDLLQTLVSPTKSSYTNMASNRPNVHINPRFQANLKHGSATPVTSRTSPHSSPKKSNTVHVNPKFANRPLPSLPSRGNLAALSTSGHLYQNTSVHPGCTSSYLPVSSSSLAVYANSGASEHVYQNICPAIPVYANTGSSYGQPTTLSSTFVPAAATVYQNTTVPGNEEPIYSTVGHGLPIDSLKQEQFIKTIKQSIQAQVSSSSSQFESSAGSCGQPRTVASNGVVLRNKYKKDNRTNNNPPNKPARNSIAARPSRYSVVEKPKRYSLMVDKPARSSVYVVDNRSSGSRPAKPARKTVALAECLPPPTSSSEAGLPGCVPDLTTTPAVVSSSSSSSSTPAIVVSSTPAVPVVSTPAASKLVTPVGRKTDEKENLPSTIKKSFLFTPLRKTPFKKIGTRKLIRVKKKSLSPGTPKPSFKRIGNTKLIRIRESLASDKSTPSSVYSIKTKSKIVKKVKNTPSNTSKFRFSFITPLSVKKNRIVKQTSGKNIVNTKKSSFASRFKLDRRDKKERMVHKKTSQTRLKKLSTGTYHVSATKLQKVGSGSAPVKPVRTRNVSIYRPKATSLNPNIAPNKVISVQGVKFAVADNGRKLKRLASGSDLGSGGGGSSSAVPSTVTYSASVSHTSPQTTSPGCLTAGSPAAAANGSSPSTAAAAAGSPSPGKFRSSPRIVPPNVVKRTYIGGEEFDEIEPGVFTRSRHSLTRQSITQAKARSINTILKVQNRSKQYCMFFNKFGKCTKKEKGTCPYIHDPSKIAVCRRFLQGACTKDKCLLSHQLDADKMPACKYFLEGVCTRENCPYLHVKVSDKAGVCERFLKGFCPNGADCGQRHVMLCPQFDKTGHCNNRDRCAFPHIARKSVDSERTDASDTKKKTAPVKPKRKSLGPSETNLKKSRVGAGTARYFDGPAPDLGDPAPGDSPAGAGSSPHLDNTDIEERRRRILRKIEQAKQVWRSSMLGETDDVVDRQQQQQQHNDREADTSGVETSETQQHGSDDTAAPPLDDDDDDDEAAVVMAGSRGRSRRRRAPLGHLGDFISLETSCCSGDEAGGHNNTTVQVDDRLI